ncbi:MAG: fumarylacetoacetate hydrolase family protein [Bernardetiaceae bacterium]|jgi:2-dehydro-3-deoxy-D-arabinonate dehydratase|nr:fumarylacetoacetate hydrolase family protein [Bernardetiaceae bacterium]
MKIYRTAEGNVIEHEGQCYLSLQPHWEGFVNRENLAQRLHEELRSLAPTGGSDWLARQTLLAPIATRQELWAAGVTYLRSRDARMEEAEQAGGGSFYDRVYEAPRPELFFKATPPRIVAPGAPVRIRRDSTWNVPEPELVLVLNAKAELVGYTVGNDMSSRSIEGENPLYLPQAKTYDGCASLGPGILVAEEPLPPTTLITLTISRQGQVAFKGEVEVGRLKRSFAELAGYLFRECSFPHGVLLMTGTGIVPSTEFTLHPGDVVSIHIAGIGTLTNPVA